MKKQTVCLTALLGLFAGVHAAVAPPMTAQPNIIYILADDMGQGDVMAYNKDSQFATPNIDRLAGEGMKFMDPHTGSSVCTPTRYGILTGRYAWRTRLKAQVLQGFSTHLIEPGRETVASLLKKQGYQTACFGKWHMGMDWQSTDGKELKSSKPLNVDFSKPIQNGPLDVGFDTYFGIAASLNMDPHAFIQDRMIQGTPVFMKDLAAVTARGFIQPAKPGWTTTDFKQDQVLPTLAAKTCAWVRQHADKPFFVYMPLNSPHSPIVPSVEFKGKSGLNDHGDFCMETDWAVGEVLKTIDDLGIAGNTLVIFTADNGTSPNAGFAFMASRGHHPSWIYRGMKGTTWEGGHRVPFIVRWPGIVKEGSVSDQLICTTDLLATFAELTGVALGDASGEDSVSFLPALKGLEIPGVKNRLVIHHSDKGVFAIRSGKWKVMFDDFGGSGRVDARADDPIINAAPLQLFNMETDAIEKYNLASQYPEVIDGMKKQLADTIKNGRSTPGAPQPTDLGTAKWPQLEPVLRELGM